jgi:hypothetical protein
MYLLPRYALLLCALFGALTAAAQWAPVWTSPSEDLDPGSPTCGAAPDTLSRRYANVLRFNDVVPTADSGYVLSGLGNGNTFSVRRLDCAAAEVWNVTVSAPGTNHEAVSALPRGDGSFWVAGKLTPGPGALPDGAVVRLAGADGTELERLLLGGTAEDFFTAMAPSVTGGAYCSGAWNSFGEEDAWLVRLDSDFDTVWTRIVDAGQDERFNDVLDADGGSYAAGRRQFPVIGGALNQGLVQRFDLAGNTIWQRLDVDSVEWFDMAPQPGGGVVVAGRYRTSSADQRMAAAAYDASGNRLWYETYGTPGQVAFAGSIHRVDGGYLLAGRRTDDSTAWLLRVDLAGQPVRSIGVDHAPGSLHAFTELFPLASGERYAAAGFLGSAAATDGWFWIGRQECGVAGFDPLPASLSVCSGSSIVLDAGAGFAAYAWSTGDSVASIEVGAAGVYSVSVVDALGCTATDSVVVAVSPLPVVDLGPDTLSACGVDSVLLDAGAGFAAYAWSTGATSSSIWVGNGWYDVTVTDANGCTGSDSVLVDVLNVSISPGDTAICAGESMVLSMNAAETIDGDPSGLGELLYRSVGVWAGVAEHSDVGDIFYLGINGRTNYVSCVPDSTCIDECYGVGNCCYTVVNTCDWQRAVRFENAQVLDTLYSAGDSSLLRIVALDSVFICDAEPGLCFDWCYAGTFECGYCDSHWALNLFSSKQVNSLSVLWSTGDTTASITVAPTETTTYTVTVTNGITTCTDSVTVTVGPPITPPVFTECPADISASAAGPVSWTEPVAPDNCYAPVTVSQIEGPPNGSVFAEGVTTVTYVATDTLGQSDTCSFTVTVSLPCPVPTMLDAFPASNGVILSWFDDPEHLGVQVRGRRVGDPFFGTTQTTSSTLAIGGLAPATTYEWRARAKCLDGDISGFSPLDTFTTLTLREAGGTELKAMPNPARDRVVVTWRGLGGEPLLQVTDAMGRVVFAGQADADGSRTLDVRSWTPGVYFVTVRGGDGTRTLPLVVDGAER